MLKIRDTGYTLELEGIETTLPDRVLIPTDVGYKEKLRNMGILGDFEYPHKIFETVNLPITKVGGYDVDFFQALLRKYDKVVDSMRNSIKNQNNRITMHTVQVTKDMRGISANENDIYIKAQIEAGYKVIPNPNDPEGMLVTFPVKWENIEFTKVATPHGEVEVNVETAIQQLERYKKYQVHWCQQNVSNTISYSLDEVEDIKEWLLKNWEHYVGVSFLYRADPSKSAEELGYLYLPQEVVTKEVYDEYTKDLTEVDFGNIEDSLDNDMESQECAGGACPVI